MSFMPHIDLANSVSTPLSADQLFQIFLLPSLLQYTQTVSYSFHELSPQRPLDVRISRQYLHLPVSGLIHNRRLNGLLRHMWERQLGAN